MAEAIPVLSRTIVNLKIMGMTQHPLGIVPKAPITICTIVTFMIHRFFNYIPRPRYLSFFSHPFSFILWSAGSKVDNFTYSLLFVNYYKAWSSGLD